MLLNLFDIKEKYNLKITGVIHIGAHFGEEDEVYKKMGINNRVYFEPVSKTFKVLVERVKDAYLFNYALGNEEKEIEMYIEDADAYGCSSILQPSENYKNVPFSTKEKVQMKRLDSFNFKEYNFLNIDVQGYEYDVLKGAEKTLNNIDYIMCEINRVVPDKPLDYINSSTLEEVMSFLSFYGFVLMETNWAGISWGDGFFIKKNTLI